MKLLMIALALFSHTVFAAGEVELSKECKTKLSEEVLSSETAYLAATGETIAHKLKADVQINYWPARDSVNIVVHAEDPADGRSVAYTATVLKTEARVCENIKLVRKTAGACRYSRHQGPESLTEIKELRFKAGQTIDGRDQISAVVEAQLRQLLDGQDGLETIGALIDATDDHEVSTATVTLPDGKVLDYYGAYGGDNPYGAFFKTGENVKVGSNNDGSVCIGYF